MVNSNDLEWLKRTHQNSLRDISSISDWSTLKNAAIMRKHTGDLDGAIEAMEKAVGLLRKIPDCIEEASKGLNYLAAELYLAKNAIEQALAAIQEAVDISQSLNPSIHADNLVVLAAIQLKGGSFAKALASAREARQLYVFVGHTYGVTQADELIGRIGTE